MKLKETTNAKNVNNVASAVAISDIIKSFDPKEYSAPNTNDIQEVDNTRDDKIKIKRKGVRTNLKNKRHFMRHLDLKTINIEKKLESKNTHTEKEINSTNKITTIEPQKKKLIV